MINLELPLTLLPNSNSEERFDLTVRAAAFRYHVDRLEVQAWALELADWWESEGVSEGLQRFSFGVRANGLSGYEPFAIAYCGGQELNYRAFSSNGKLQWEAASDTEDLSVSERNLSIKIMNHLQSFPCNPKEKRWSVAFKNPQGHTLADWRQSILKLLDPQDLANFQAKTLDVQTPISEEGTPKRL